ncbi:hypothetical protein HCN44_002006 [Aphidius gifuensis]|uniref:3-dehydrosphinganine reductase n=1 Tax=Aphidius gifuensis TaxID=684658 RepID=A0A835CTV0_APHGI|nr:3-ketodihydrosphingosine reductase [Aphidius gifuensis]KAF7996374.1 hypothetical protein HCN44_002006 [Aphidius gifuensis]
MGVLLGVFLIVFVLLIVGLILSQLFWRKRLKNIQGQHVVITGGSSGIGKSFAILAAKNGANVTIIARDIKKLETAKNEIQHSCQNKDKQKIEYLSLDVASSFENIEKSFNELEKNSGPIFMLVNCAGKAIGGKIEDSKIDDVKFMWNLNFLGTYQCIKAVVPRMKNSRDGIIIITSSMAAFSGVFGLSAYSSTKFALRGLAESLKMELNPYNIFVTMALPPDTDTPGFAIEEATKPLETKLISDSCGTFSPDVVANQMLEDSLAGKFFSTVGMEGFLLGFLCAGMSPVCSIGQVILEFLLMGFCRIIGACYLATFNNTIKKCMKTRDQNKKCE